MSEHYLCRACIPLFNPGCLPTRANHGHTSLTHPNDTDTHEILYPCKCKPLTLFITSILYPACRPPR